MPGHNLNYCSAPAKASGQYQLSLVCLTVEYASCVWDHHEAAVHIQTLEKVQRRAARWVLSDYGRQSV